MYQQIKNIKPCNIPSIMINTNVIVANHRFQPYFFFPFKYYQPHSHCSQVERNLPKMYRHTFSQIQYFYYLTVCYTIYNQLESFFVSHDFCHFIQIQYKYINFTIISMIFWFNTTEHALYTIIILNTTTLRRIYVKLYFNISVGIGTFVIKIYFLFR